MRQLRATVEDLEQECERLTAELEEKTAALETETEARRVGESRQEADREARGRDTVPEDYEDLHSRLDKMSGQVESLKESEAEYRVGKSLTQDRLEASEALCRRYEDTSRL